MLRGDSWDPPGEPILEILMLHGGAQTRHSWDRAAANLVASGYRVVTIDARGHGDSDWSEDGEYSVYSMRDDYHEIIAQLFPGTKPVVVGASMGGLTAKLSLGEHHDTASALVLVDVTPRLEADGIQRIGDFLRSAPNGFDSLDEVADLVAAYQPHRTRPKNTDGLKKNLRQREDGRWYWHWDPRFARNTANREGAKQGTEIFSKMAKNIEVPVLLIKGQHSDIVSEQGVEELKQLIPHAYTHEVSGAGHMVAGDDNAVFLDQLEWFLTEIIRSTNTG